MIIKSVTKHIKDGFLANEGWGNWARIDLRQNKIINSDNKINNEMAKALINQVRITAK